MRECDKIMIYDIKNIVNTKEVYEIYSLCMYLPTFDKYTATFNEYLADSNINVYGFYDNNILVGAIAIRISTEKKLKF